jgi:hypothetical protein
MADLDRIPAIQKEAVSSTKLAPNKRMQTDVAYGHAADAGR